jgi:hypothetical protein
MSSLCTLVGIELSVSVGSCLSQSFQNSFLVGGELYASITIQSTEAMKVEFKHEEEQSQSVGSCLTDGIEIKSVPLA